MKSRFTALLLLFFVISTAFVIQPTPPEVVTITGVHDGDSYYCVRNGERIKVRIWGCDSPEILGGFVTKTQPYGVQAGDAVRAFLKGRPVIIDSITTDGYDRMVAKIYIPVDSTTNIDLTQMLIKNGLAWAVKYSNMSEAEYRILKDMQFQARDSKIGLWGIAGRKLLPSTWRSRYNISKKQQVKLELSQGIK